MTARTTEAFLRTSSGSKGLCLSQPFFPPPYDMVKAERSVAPGSKFDNVLQQRYLKILSARKMKCGLL